VPYSLGSGARLSTQRAANGSLCRCPPRQKSRVERLNAKVEPLLTLVTVEYRENPMCESSVGPYGRVVPTDILTGSSSSLLLSSLEVSDTQVYEP